MRAEDQEGRAVASVAEWGLPALLNGVSTEQGVQDRVNGLLEVLYEDSVP